ncbi:MAG: hypothetical protein FJW31_01885 [Acidobacteria bacterium]|nr:hypothetical protein [Acidobacteriota bacterium]
MRCGSGTTQQAAASTTTQAASTRNTASYVPSRASVDASSTGPVAEANTVSICAAPRIRPKCARPKTWLQTEKNITVTMPPATPIAAAHSIVCVTVVTNRSAAIPTAISRCKDHRGASHPPAKFASKPSIVLTTSV